MTGQSWDRLQRRRSQESGLQTRSDRRMRKVDRRMRIRWMMWAWWCWMTSQMSPERTKGNTRRLLFRHYCCCYTHIHCRCWRKTPVPSALKMTWHGCCQGRRCHSDWQNPVLTSLHLQQTRRMSWPMSTLAYASLVLLMTRQSSSWVWDAGPAEIVLSQRTR